MTLLRAAVAWQVFELSGSAFYLGLLGVVQFGSRRSASRSSEARRWPTPTIAGA